MVDIGYIGTQQDGFSLAGAGTIDAIDKNTIVASELIQATFNFCQRNIYGAGDVCNAEFNRLADIDTSGGLSPSSLSSTCSGVSPGDM